MTRTSIGKAVAMLGKLEHLKGLDLQAALLEVFVEIIHSIDSTSPTDWEKLDQQRKQEWVFQFEQFLGACRFMLRSTGKSHSELADVSAAIIELQLQVEALLCDEGKMRQELELARSQIDKLADSNSGTRAALEKRRGQHDELLATKKRLVDENQELMSKIDLVESEIERLREEMAIHREPALLAQAREFFLDRIESCMDDVEKFTRELREISKRLEEGERELALLREKREQLISEHSSCESQKHEMMQDIRMVRTIHDFAQLYETIKSDETMSNGRKEANDRLAEAARLASDELASITQQIGDLENRREVILREHLLLSEKSWQEIRRLIS